MLAVLAVITHQTFAADESLSMTKLAQKALADRIGDALLFHLDPKAPVSKAPVGRVCAIPLLEPRMQAAKHIDPISRPVPLKSFDHMARLPQVKACPRP